MTTEKSQRASPEAQTEALPVGNPGTAENKPEKPKYDKEELLRIFDQILFEGEYEEKKELRGGRLKVVFRSRSADDIVAISQEIDNGKFQLITTMQETRALLNLAHSLVEYNGRDYRKTDVKERRALIGKLPGPVVGLLSEALTRFDEKVAEACLEGQENF